jgi:4-hydroxybenzoate polyprenyltransferase
MLQLFRLIRLPNLIIIALTLYGVRYGLLLPVWESGIALMLDNDFLVRGLGLSMSSLDFLLLTVSTLFIAAAGYIINDYFDVKTDRLNRPDKVVVGRIIPRRLAMILHMTLSSLGLLLAVYVAWNAGNWRLCGLQIFSIVALWFYSTHLKKQLLSGNILIALLAALVPLTAGLYEFASGSLISLNVLSSYVPGAGSILLRKAAVLVTGYAVFAFLSNLIREIVKDIEDMDGDRAAGCKTLPVVVGEIQAKFIALSLVVFTVITLALVQRYLYIFDYQALFYYTLIAVQLPFVVMFLMLWRANTKDDYSRVSLICKLLIVTGVISMIVFGMTL